MLNWPPHELGRLIVVAGPSGAGKSAFMRDIATGRLPPEIQGRLPADVRTWMHFGNTRAEIKRYAPYAAQLPWLNAGAQQGHDAGLILQYDLTRSTHAYVEDYAADPMLHVLLMAGEMIVINVRPERGRLMRQWAFAQMGARTHRDIRRKELAWWISIAAARAARGLRRVSPRLLGRLEKLRLVDDAREWVRVQLASVRKNPVRWLATYRSSHRIDTLFDRWQAFLATVAAHGVDIRQIDIEPEPNAPIADHSNGLGDRCGWRLVRRMDTVANGEGLFHPCARGLTP